MTSANARLDTLLAAIDKLIIESPIAEMLDTSAQKESAAVRALIRQAIVTQAPDREQADELDTEKETKRIKLDEHIEMLQRLAVTQPHLRPQLDAVFGSKKRPSAQAVKKLIDDLTQSGIDFKPKK